MEGSGGAWEVIWDTGGNDTITAENEQRDVEIDLSMIRNVHHGDAGAHAFSGISGVPINKLVIPYGVTIQNAIGGNRDDTIVGSGGPNVLRGSAGDDVLVTRGGADTVYGGEG